MCMFSVCKVRNNSVHDETLREKLLNAPRDR